MGSIIQVRGVAKSFGSKIIFDEANLDVGDGEIFGIIGLSGCGKTTLLKTMVGFLKPDSGEIIFNHEGKDYDIFKQSSKSRKFFGFSTQGPSFYQKLTVNENLLYFASLYGISKKVAVKNVEYLIKLTALENSENTIADNLSDGMQKRLSMACALIHNPKVLLLDEPTADLDPINRKLILDLISKVNKLGTTVIIASHLLEELEIICSRVAIIHDKRIVAVGTPKELEENYSRTDELILTTSGHNYGDIAAELGKYSLQLGIQKLFDKEAALIVYTENSEKTLHYLVHILEKKNETVLSLNLSRPSLKEIFESIAAVKAMS